MFLRLRNRIFPSRGQKLRTLKRRKPRRSLRCTAFDFLDLILLELVAKAHDIPETVDEKRKDPAASAGVGLDAGGMEDLVGEVATEETPRGAVGGGANCFLGSVQDFAGGRGGGPIGEDGAVVDEGVVDEGVVVSSRSWKLVPTLACSLHIELVST
ncbi:hypothetical protein Salat_0829400 [Sesamum alatum]|uniref:Uncharacterized protein n=1 Tax=Sesamum alatum TaxID=300844 RepID=A0AAE1YV39_9LAMI|nr:hypothetical protein Salat_0829400 [Sesamum alatum]